MSEFWVNGPSALLADPSFLPNGTMTRGEVLNSLTRLSFVVGLLLFAAGNESWLSFVLGSVLALVVVWSLGEKEENEGYTEVEAEDEPSTLVETRERTRTRWNRDNNTFRMELVDGYKRSLERSRNDIGWFRRGGRPKNYLGVTQT